MSQLVDWQIHDWCLDGTVKPYESGLLQSASLDVRLGNVFRMESGAEFTVRDGEYFDMGPGRFVLGTTMERFSIPHVLAARIEGKSTWGRRGLTVHSTAGFIDPGFEGELTLELKNISASSRLKLHPGVAIAQVTFHALDGVPDKLYGDPALGSHYQGQTGPTPAAK